MTAAIRTSLLFLVLACLGCFGPKYGRDDLKPWVNQVAELMGDADPLHAPSRQLNPMLAPAFHGETFESTFGKPFKELSSDELHDIFLALIKAYPERWVLGTIAVPFQVERGEDHFRGPWLQAIARFEGTSPESVIAERDAEKATRERSRQAHEERRRLAQAEARERRMRMDAELEKGLLGVAALVAGAVALDEAARPSPVTATPGRPGKTWYECADLETRGKVQTYIYNATWGWKNYNDLIEQLEVKVWDQAMYDEVDRYNSKYLVGGPSIRDDAWAPIQEAIESIRHIKSVPLSR